MKKQDAYDLLLKVYPDSKELLQDMLNFFSALQLSELVEHVAEERGYNDVEEMINYYQML